MKSSTFVKVVSKNPRPESRRSFMELRGISGDIATLVLVPLQSVMSALYHVYAQGAVV